MICEKKKISTCLFLTGGTGYGDTVLTQRICAHIIIYIMLKEDYGGAGIDENYNISFSFIIYENYYLLKFSTLYNHNYII